MRTRIKFCGLVRAADVDAAVALGVDAVGFVFYPRSPRHLSVDEARALRARLPSFVQAVGLFVDESPQRIGQVAAAVGLDVLQLHGNETPEACGQASLAAGGLPWWRAVRMRARSDLLESTAAYPQAECLLLDAYSDGYGGSGKRFDWAWAAPIADPAGRPVRCILSGGLDAVTVGQAIAQVAPFAVDVSSGIQGADPRTKDAARMHDFVAAAIAADANRSGPR